MHFSRVIPQMDPKVRISSNASYDWSMGVMLKFQLQVSLCSDGYQLQYDRAYSMYMSDSL